MNHPPKIPKIVTRAASEQSWQTPKMSKIATRDVLSLALGLAPLSETAKGREDDH